MTYYDNGEYRKRYIKVFEGAGKSGRGGLAIAEEVPGGAVLFNFVPMGRRGLNRNREGVLLNPKGDKDKARSPRGTPPKKSLTYRTPIQSSGLCRSV